jgi:DNA polymerase (family 10)
MVRAATREELGGRRVANTEIARMLRDLADLLEIGAANPFRVRAYRTAAHTIETWPAPVSELAKGGVKELTRLPGLGADMAGKVMEIVTTGSLGQLRTEMQKLPPGVLDMLRVPGLGPKRVRALFDALGVSTLEQLEQAAAAGRVRQVQGFTARGEAKLLAEIRGVKESAKRFLRAEASLYAEALLAHLAHLPGVHEAEIAGSYRRRKDTVGDIDLLVTCDAGCPVLDHFAAYESVAQLLAKGPTRASARLRVGLQVDVRVLERDAFGAGLCYFTGSQAHSIALRRIAQQQGLKLNEYGLFKGARRVAGRTERDLYGALGLPWIPPELREDHGELDAARAGALPDLIELEDIKGDLQMHTTASDGRNTLATMAEAARALGYRYIAVTDHTPLLKMIRGLDRGGFRKQWQEIDRLNARWSDFTILKGAEVDIVADGTLDLDEDTMAELDLVQVSLHTKLALPAAEQNQRVLKALRHPSIDVFGHPFGRLLLRREGAQFNLDEVCRVCAGQGIMLEVNSAPDRLDLDDVAVHTALRHGVTLTISTDAHNTRELSNIRWGVDQSRRGWATRGDVANTLSLGQLRKRLHQGRR